MGTRRNTELQQEGKEARLQLLTFLQRRRCIVGVVGSEPRDARRGGLESLLELFLKSTFLEKGGFSLKVAVGIQAGRSKGGGNALAPTRGTL